MFSLFGSKNRVTPEVRSLKYSNTKEYWRDRFEREREFFQKLASTADEELTKSRRRDWWGNYPGVGGTCWRHFCAGLEAAYAEEWELAQSIVSGRCLPYQFVLSSSEFPQLLKEHGPEHQLEGIAELQECLGYATPFVGSPWTVEPLKIAARLWREHLTTNTKWREQWPHLYEFQAVRTAMLGLTIGDFGDTFRHLQSLPAFQVFPDYANRLVALANNPQDANARSAYFEHFDAVRAMGTRPRRWTRPEGFSEPEYRFTCGLLADRISTNWSEDPNWRAICSKISSE